MPEAIPSQFEYHITADDDEWHVMDVDLDGDAYFALHLDVCMYAMD